METIESLKKWNAESEIKNQEYMKKINTPKRVFVVGCSGTMKTFFYSPQIARMLAVRFSEHYPSVGKVYFFNENLNDVPKDGNWTLYDKPILYSGQNLEKNDVLVIDDVEHLKKKSVISVLDSVHNLVLVGVSNKDIERFHLSNIITIKSKNLKKNNIIERIFKKDSMFVEIEKIRSVIELG